MIYILRKMEQNLEVGRGSFNRTDLWYFTVTGVVVVEEDQE